LEDRSNSEKSNQTTLKTQFPLLRFVEVIFVAEKPKQTVTKMFPHDESTPFLPTE